MTSRDNSAMPSCLVLSTRRDGLKGHDGGAVPHYKLMAQDALWPLWTCLVVWQFITKRPRLWKRACPGKSEREKGERSPGVGVYARLPRTAPPSR